MKKAGIAYEHYRVFPIGDISIAESTWQRFETSVQCSAVEKSRGE
jgi:hypothetical protein